MSIRIGLVGLGKIATTQHVPAIAATPGIALHAVASRNAALPGVPGYSNIAALIAAEPGLTAITLCTPPQGRFDQAAAALLAGKHLMIEKPPGATVATSFMNAGRRYVEPGMSAADQDRYFAEMAQVGRALCAAPVPSDRIGAQRLMATCRLRDNHLLSDATISVQLPQVPSARSRLRAATPCRTARQAP